MLQLALEHKIKTTNTHTLSLLSRALLLISFIFKEVGSSKRVFIFSLCLVVQECQARPHRWCWMGMSAWQQEHALFNNCHETAQKNSTPIFPPSLTESTWTRYEIQTRIQTLAQGKPTAAGQAWGFLLTWNDSGAGKLKSTHWSFSKPGAASELNQHVLFLQWLNQPLIKLIRDSRGF